MRVQRGRSRGLSYSRSGHAARRVLQGTHIASTDIISAKVAKTRKTKKSPLESNTSSSERNFVKRISRRSVLVLRLAYQKPHTPKHASDKPCVIPKKQGRALNRQRAPRQRQLHTHASSSREQPSHSKNRQHTNTHTHIHNQNPIPLLKPRPVFPQRT